MCTYKIVLTGGPCGGKTESIPFLLEKLRKQKYSLEIVDETANSLLELGYMPNVNISTFDFQNLLFKIQFLKEYMSEGKSKILLCDRGLFDGKVYIDNIDFKKILDVNKVDEQKIFSTYDAALYFRSISYEYPNEFIKYRIYETPEIGRMRDERCKEIWSQKIIPCEYSNFDGLEKKQELIYNSLEKQIKLLEKVNPNNLSDYYDNEYFKYIYNGIDDIFEKSNVSTDTKVKTKRLIK